MLVQIERVLGQFSMVISEYLRVYLSLSTGYGQGFEPLLFLSLKKRTLELISKRLKYYLGSDLISALAGLDVDDLTHGVSL